MKHNYIDLLDPRIVHLLCNLDEKYTPMKHDKSYRGFFYEIETVVDGFKKASEECIPIKVIKKELNRIALADQCDQGTSYDRELARALKLVLDWYNSPNYDLRVEKVTGIKELKRSEQAGSFNSALGTTTRCMFE